MKLNDTISTITGVGPSYKKKLHNLGIKTVGHLLEHYPRNYLFFTDPKPISSYRIGNDAIIKASIVSLKNSITRKKHMTITHAKLEDDNGDTITATWFNQPFLQDLLHVGSTWLFAGKIVYDFSLKTKTLQSPMYTKKTEILAIYPETEGISSKYIRKIVSIALAKTQIAETLPDYIKINENLLSKNDAIKLIHCPKNQKDIALARRRLSFEEFYHISKQILTKKMQYKSHDSYQINVLKNRLVSFTKGLPFELTYSQQKAIYEIISDISKPHPMTRLINGDVGSGKTIVGATACFLTKLSGFRSVWMAPTEILANQHYQTLCELFRNENISIGLLTANKKLVNNKEQVLNRNNKTTNTKSIKDKPILHTTSYSLQDVLSCDIIIGTHSLIQDNVSIDKLALVIVDEEHRFGVKQRAKLITLNHDKKFVPHYLSMTATPIPRTLAISLYADFDISIIDQMPTGRKTVITRFVDPKNRILAYDFVRKHLSRKRQVFVICPLIQQNASVGLKSDDVLQLFEIEKKSVMKEYEKLSKTEFSQYKVAYLHGKLKSEEKQNIMHDFSQNVIDVLVSTSVVEVGVNIPNASVMIIEDAERFGLAQLHQFRGRVGRGVHQSFCLLFSNTVDPVAIKRLQAMESKTSGFDLSEIDLATRGPGEFVGNKQSGFLTLKIARLSDTITLNLAKSYAKRELGIVSK